MTTGKPTFGVPQNQPQEAKKVKNEEIATFWKGLSNSEREDIKAYFFSEKQFFSDGNNRLEVVDTDFFKGLVDIAKKSGITNTEELRKELQNQFGWERVGN